MTWAEFKDAVDKQIEEQGWSGLLVTIDYIEINVVCDSEGLAVFN